MYFFSTALSITWILLATTLKLGRFGWYPQRPTRHAERRNYMSASSRGERIRLASEPSYRRLGFNAAGVRQCAGYTAAVLLSAATWSDGMNGAIAQTVTAYYQPTPFPLKCYTTSTSCPGGSLPQDLNKVHIHDGWLNNTFSSIEAFQRDDRLKGGGWGDVYRSYINMDLTGLPASPSSVVLWLRFFPPGTATTTFQFCIPNQSWNTTMTWASQPTILGCTQEFSPPTTDSWAGWYITNWYQNWQSGVWGKNGMMLNAQYNNDNFDFIRSSRYADFATDPLADGKRPILQFDFTPTAQLKMPLPSGYSWLLTNEVGGYECMGQNPWPDPYHQDVTSPGNYFSIDISWQNKPIPGKGESPSPYNEFNTPILAAGPGIVNFAGGGNTTSDPNGYYVVIDHTDATGARTGFQTRYLHMAGSPSVLTGQANIKQGQMLGTMGNTGKNPDGSPTTTATHLHFGVRYQGSGASTVPQLTTVLLESLLLKSYQTECAVNSSGVPTARIRYYPSN
jgi:hypothetical protein